MKQILAIPKSVFDIRFDNDNIRSHSNACFISILDEDNTEQNYDLSMDNFLQVRMWDIEYDIKYGDKIIYQKPPDSELRKIVEFVNRHKDKTYFIVHCSAGVSRSGAVATYIKDKFHEEIDKDKFRQYNKHIMPNLYILKQLKTIKEVNI